MTACINESMQSSSEGVVILGRGDHAQSLEWVVMVKQTGMSNWNSESMSEEREAGFHGKGRI